MKHLHYCVPGKHWYSRSECAHIQDEHDCTAKLQITCDKHKEK